MSTQSDGWGMDTSPTVMDTLNAERGDTVTITNPSGGWGGASTSNCHPLHPRDPDSFKDPLGTNTLAIFIGEILVDGSCTTVTRRHTPCDTDGQCDKASTTYVLRLDDQFALPENTHAHIMNTNTSADVYLTLCLHAIGEDDDLPAKLYILASRADPCEDQEPRLDITAMTDLLCCSAGDTETRSVRERCESLVTGVLGSGDHPNPFPDEYYVPSAYQKWPELHENDDLHITLFVPNVSVAILFEQRAKPDGDLAVWVSDDIVGPKGGIPSHMVDQETHTMYGWIAENLNNRPTVAVGMHPSYAYIAHNMGLGSGWFRRDASPGSQWINLAKYKSDPSIILAPRQLASSAPRKFADAISDNIVSTEELATLISVVDDDDDDRTKAPYHRLHPVQAKLATNLRNLTIELGEINEHPALNKLSRFTEQLQILVRNLAALKPGTGTRAVQFHETHTKDLLNLIKQLVLKRSAHVRANNIKLPDGAWTIRLGLVTALKLSDEIFERLSAISNLRTSTMTVRISGFLEACEHIKRIMLSVRVVANAAVLVGLQGSGKSRALQALSKHFPAFTVIFEDRDSFMPLLTEYSLAAANNVDNVITQNLCYGTQTQILLAGHDLVSNFLHYVTERGPTCSLAYCLVAYKNGHLSRKQFYMITSEVARVGFLAGHVWYVEETVANCKARMLARADAEPDPIKKAQHQAEADAPTALLEDLTWAHQLVYLHSHEENPRVAVIRETLPLLEAGHDDEYDAQIARIFGTRLQAHFTSVGITARLGAANDAFDADDNDGLPPAIGALVDMALAAAPSVAHDTPAKDEAAATAADTATAAAAEPKASK